MKLGGQLRGAQGIEEFQHRRGGERIVFGHGDEGGRCPRRNVGYGAEGCAVDGRDEIRPIGGEVWVVAFSRVADLPLLPRMR